MAQQDYILRMIEQFGQLAIALRKLITGGKSGSEDVQDRLQSAARHAGLDLELARTATPETLAMMVSPGGQPEPARCWMFAETLFLDGMDARLAGDADRAWDSYRKSRMLFEMVAPHGAFLVGYPEASERMAEIDGRLEEMEGMPRRVRARRP